MLRALITLMKALAFTYGVEISATNGHTATDDQVKKSYGKLVKKMHPNKGGRKADFQKLQYPSKSHPPLRFPTVSWAGFGVSHTRWNVIRGVKILTRIVQGLARSRNNSG